MQSFVRTLIKLVNEGSSMRKYKGKLDAGSTLGVRTDRYSCRQRQEGSTAPPTDHLHLQRPVRRLHHRDCRLELIVEPQLRSRPPTSATTSPDQIGRASCRERVS